jgi:hypothetical protein
MRKFDIFKPGKQTASNGVSLDFSEDLIRQAVEAYDPELHEAPIVVGHPKDNHPAFGWIKSLEYADGMMVADPHQVDPTFAELVESGRYKKRSASFYLPDSPSNPKPGTLYLRHVGFLGAQPPAVKGLRDVAFSDAEEGIVEFEERNSSPYIWSLLGNFFRNMREKIIADDGIEAANNLIPAYYIDEVNAEAERKRNAQNDKPMPVASFNDPNHEENDMTPEQIKALQDENARLKAEAAKVADFAERESGLAAREAKIAESEKIAARAGVESRVDAAVKEGRLLPAQKKSVVDFAMSLADADATIDFGEGDQAKKVTQREAYLLDIESRGKVIDFGEHAKGTGNGDDFDVNAAQRKIFDQVASGKADA